MKRDDEIATEILKQVEDEIHQVLLKYLPQMPEASRSMHPGPFHIKLPEKASLLRGEKIIRLNTVFDMAVFVEEDKVSQP